jgi:MraZ protein
MEHLFRGSSLGRVEADGRVRLPLFVRQVIERRSDARAALFGAHESDPCLTGYDLHYPPIIQRELDRRKLREEADGAGPEAHHARARQAFGFVEEADFDGEGDIVLPDMMRRKGRIEDLALFVGTGGSFEIWNPHVACAAGDPALKALAEYRLEKSGDRQGDGA